MILAVDNEFPEAENAGKVIRINNKQEAEIVNICRLNKTLYPEPLVNIY